MNDLNSTTNNEKTKKTAPYAPRGQGAEARRVNARLTGFRVKQSNAYKSICKKFSPNITHSELKSVAMIICLQTGLKLDRDATRDNRVLIKWFDENWTVIKKNWDFITLLDDERNTINNSRHE